MFKKISFSICLLVVACSKEDEPEKTCTQIIDSTVWTSVDQVRLSQDIQTIDNYLADNSLTAIQDPSGLRYQITKSDPNETETPCLESKILVRYTGILMSNSTIFDEVNTGITLNLSNLIAGWQIAFLKFTKGTEATLYIPSGLAYGPKVNGSIPANANLIFFVELVDFE
jgi:FKBP-type peptidyl-prolyl cis-trans isomerase FkpA